MKRRGHGEGWCGLERALSDACPISSPRGVPTKRAKLVAVLAVMMVGLPLTTSPSTGRLVVVQEACGQALGCGPSADYVCVTSIGDVINYVCNYGCDAEEE